MRTVSATLTSDHRLATIGWPPERAAPTAATASSPREHTVVILLTFLPPRPAHSSGLAAAIELYGRALHAAE